MKVELVNAEVFKLDLDARYIIGLDANTVTMDDAQSLLTALKNIGIRNAVALVTRGDPHDAIKVIKQESVPYEPSSNPSPTSQVHRS